MDTKKMDSVLQQYYHEEFEPVHVPEGVKQATLQEVYKRNIRNSDRMTARQSILTRYLISSRTVAMAAMLVLVIVGTTFFAIRNSELPVIHAGQSVTDITVLYRAESNYKTVETEAGPTTELFPKTIDKLDLVETKVWIVTSEDGMKVDEITILIYRDEERILQLIVSQNEPYAPPEIYSLNTKDINGIPTYLAKDAEENLLYAAWTEGEWIVSASLENGNARQFLTILRQVIGSSELK